MVLRERYDFDKEKLINDCIKCGNCISQCKGLKMIDKKLPTKEVQNNIIDFLDGKEQLTTLSKEKVEACMACFGCLDVSCKINVSSMTINELIKWEFEEKREDLRQEDIYPNNLKMAREKTTSEEFKRITTQDIKATKTLFFPGCNVYMQPDKLLSALDVLDAIGEEYSFIPGIENCCGLIKGLDGNAEWAEASARKLMALAEKLKINTMVFWCPCCLCMVEERIKQFYQPPFRCISLANYINENIDKLNFPQAKEQNITLHEPCTTAYRGIDLGVRSVLQAIPGVNLIEMERHGKNTVCCGWKFEEVKTDLCAKRFIEAETINCEVLVDVCHYCHLTFKGAAKELNEIRDNSIKLDIKNYITYITEAMGISREDTLNNK